VNTAFQRLDISAKSKGWRGAGREGEAYVLVLAFWDEPFAVSAQN